ncbi:unnamed protein product [Colias eurytheme]|nr:unnamed protein product [Colias eurytheme]
MYLGIFETAPTLSLEPSQLCVLGERVSARAGSGLGAGTEPTLSVMSPLFVSNGTNVSVPTRFQFSSRSEYVTPFWP